MKLYAISTKYQPLVSMNMEPGFLKKLISKKSVSNQDLLSTFNASKLDSLIACDNKDMALTVMGCLLKAHNTTPDFVENGVRFFAVPVIYTVEIDKASLPEEKTLTADDLIHYADKTTIPLYFHLRGLDEAEKLRMTQLINKSSEAIKGRKLNGLQLEHVVDATYLKSDGSSLISSDMSNSSCVNMQVLSGFIAAMGVAAVAIAFVVLNAATLGTAGICVAAIGLTATLLGGFGLFKYASKPGLAFRTNDSDDPCLIGAPGAG